VHHRRIAHQPRRHRLDFRDRHRLGEAHDLRAAGHPAHRLEPRARDDAQRSRAIGAHRLRAIGLRPVGEAHDEPVGRVPAVGRVGGERGKQGEGGADGRQ